MTDENRPEEPDPEGTTRVAEPTPEGPEAAEGAEEQKERPKLDQSVDVRDAGPCRKHIKVTIKRESIEGRLDEKYKEIMPEANVAGFRPGKAPRALVRRRYEKDVTDQVKAEVLLESLEQLAEENNINPISAPDLDPFKIDLPKDGPLVYEFEVEVRPEFDLPNYKGLRLKRQTKTFTEDDVAREKRRLLAPYGQVVPKPEGNAQEGDAIVADVVSRDGDRVLGTITESVIRVEPRLAFKDGVAERFAEQVRGANPGDSREVDITLSSGVADPALRGKTVKATFQIKDVKTVRMPELTHEFLHNFGVHSEAQLDEAIRVLLQRRLEYLQRQSIRQQVLEQLAANADWQLPPDLLARQARKSLARRVMEMRNNGIPEEEIRARQRLLQQDVLQSTALALKEHFVLQKIAEVEKIEIDEDDLNDEIDRIAEANNESPRRVRARLEKEDLMDALASEMIEREALDLILGSAEYDDVPLDPQEQETVATVEEQAVPGEMHDPTAEAPPLEGASGEASPAAAPPEGEPPAQS
jgi:trigger factor